MELHLLVRNIFFILHLFYRDPECCPILGHNHSSFSRYSPLAGQLRFMEHVFQDLSYHAKWDAQTPPVKERRTMAFLFHLSALFLLFET